MLFERSCLLVATLLSAAACQQAPISAAPEQDGSDTGQLTEAAALTATCSGCHAGPESVVPSLDRMNAGALQERLAFYKADTEGTTVMHRIARGYSQTQVESISRYLGADTVDE